MPGGDSQQILEWIRHLEVGDKLIAPDQVEQAVQSLEKMGWEKVCIGKSGSGKPIWAVHWGGEGRKVVAYGYPHPDEPVGALALYSLAKALAHPDIPSRLQDIDWWFVLCADPDQADLNKDWIKAPSLDLYLQHHWRPIYQHLEVDYQFPIDHPPFWQPRSLSLRGLTPPLPESLAIADLLQSVQPDLLGLMHGNHVSGSYTYLSHRPSDHLIGQWDEIDSQLGIMPHWGEKPDPGKRWKTSRPDILKEKRLAERKRQAEKRFGNLDGRRLVGCVSAAQYLESLKPEAVVITPEVGLWQPEGISNLAHTSEKRSTWTEYKEGRKGWRAITCGKMVMPDGSKQEVCYSVLPVSGPKKSHRQTQIVTAGMAGVEAVENRRWLLSLADQIYQTACLPKETVRLFERSKISVPGPRVNDQSMLIFRTSPRYQKIARIAQTADFRYRWGMQTCLWIAHGVQLYREQEDLAALQAQSQLLEQAKTSLLCDLPPMTPIANQACSQIGRMLLALVEQDLIQ